MQTTELDQAICSLHTTGPGAHWCWGWILAFGSQHRGLGEGEARIVAKVVLSTTS